MLRTGGRWQPPCTIVPVQGVYFVGSISFFPKFLSLEEIPNKPGKDESESGRSLRREVLLDLSSEHSTFRATKSLAKKRGSGIQ